MRRVEHVSDNELTPVRSIHMTGFIVIDRPTHRGSSAFVH